MMASQLGLHYVDPTHATYAAASRQLAVNTHAHTTQTHTTQTHTTQMQSQTRRLSRGSNSQRSMPALRVTKPNSANNSPQSSILQARRRAMVLEGLQRAQQPMYDHQYLATPGPECYDGTFGDVERRNTRPASWHCCCPQVPQPRYCLPGPPPPMYQPQPVTYAPPKLYEADMYSRYLDMPHTPVAYSTFASPAPALSPLLDVEARHGHAEPLSMFPSMPWTQNSQSQSQAMPPVPALDPPSAGSSTSAGLPNVSLRLPASSRQSTSLDWASFSSRPFDPSAMPPTPENLPSQTLTQANVKVEPEESFGFPPEDDDTEGEVLYGMGLYDAPERESLHGPWRTCGSGVMPLLGGAGEAAPRGCGLKLEDAWEPPVTDEDDGDNESGEEA